MLYLLTSFSLGSISFPCSFSRGCLSSTLDFAVSIGLRTSRGCSVSLITTALMSLSEVSLRDFGCSFISGPPSIKSSFSFSRETSNTTSFSPGSSIFFSSGFSVWKSIGNTTGLASSLDNTSSSTKLMLLSFISGTFSFSFTVSSVITPSFPTSFMSLVTWGVCFVKDVVSVSCCSESSAKICVFICRSKSIL